MGTVPYTPADLTLVYAALLRKHGQRLQRVVKILTPRDAEDDIEVLFLGADGEPLTAYVHEGRGEPAVLICSGW